MNKVQSVSKNSEHEIAGSSSSKQTRFSKRQFELLGFLYSRRFVTTRQVQQFLGKAQIQQAQQRLNTLLAKDYIGRSYSNEDKLMGRYAIYFLTDQGIALLKRWRYSSPYALRLLKKDATASERFALHSLAVGDAMQLLHKLYPKPTYETHFMTKTDVLKYDADQYDGGIDYEPWSTNFPKPYPDGFFDLAGAEDWSSYIDGFVEVWHDTVPFWVYRKRILYYIDYHGEEDWKDISNEAVLNVFLLCDTPTLQRRVQRYLRRISDSIYTDELRFLVTNRALLETAETNDAIWTLVGDEETRTLRLSELTTET